MDVERAPSVGPQASPPSLIQNSTTSSMGVKRDEKMPNVLLQQHDQAQELAQMQQKSLLAQLQDANAQLQQQMDRLRNEKDDAVMGIVKLKEQHLDEKSKRVAELEDQLKRKMLLDPLLEKSVGPLWSKYEPSLVEVRKSPVMMTNNNAPPSSAVVMPPQAHVGASIDLGSSARCLPSTSSVIPSTRFGAPLITHPAHSITTTTNYTTPTPVPLVDALPHNAGYCAASSSSARAYPTHAPEPSLSSAPPLILSPKPSGLRLLRQTTDPMERSLASDSKLIELMNTQTWGEGRQDALKQSLFARRDGIPHRPLSIVMEPPSLHSPYTNGHVYNEENDEKEEEKQQKQIGLLNSTSFDADRALAEFNAHALKKPDGMDYYSSRDHLDMSSAKVDLGKAQRLDDLLGNESEELQHGGSTLNTKGMLLDVLLPRNSTTSFSLEPKNKLEAAVKSLREMRGESSSMRINTNHALAGSASQSRDDIHQELQEHALKSPTKLFKEQLDYKALKRSSSQWNDVGDTPVSPLQRMLNAVPIASTSTPVGHYPRGDGSTTYPPSPQNADSHKKSWALDGVNHENALPLRSFPDSSISGASNTNNHFFMTEGEKGAALCGGTENFPSSPLGKMLASLKKSSSVGSGQSANLFKTTMSSRPVSREENRGQDDGRGGGSESPLQRMIAKLRSQERMQQEENKKHETREGENGGDNSLGLKEETSPLSPLGKLLDTLRSSSGGGKMLTLHEYGQSTSEMLPPCPSPLPRALDASTSFPNLRSLERDNNDNDCGGSLTYSLTGTLPSPLSRWARTEELDLSPRPQLLTRGGANPRNLLQETPGSGPDTVLANTPDLPALHDALLQANDMNSELRQELLKLCAPSLSELRRKRGRPKSSEGLIRS